MGGLSTALKDSPDKSKLSPIFVEVVRAGLGVITREDYVQLGVQTPCLEAFNEIIEHCDFMNLQEPLKDLGMTLC